MSQLAPMNSTRHTPSTVARTAYLFCKSTAISVAISLFLGMILSGCATSATSSTRDRRGPAAITIQADWDDIDAAVETGVAKAEAVVVRSSAAPDGMQHRYELKHVSGVTGVLNARVEGSGKDPRSITLSCTMGAMENAGVAKNIVDRVARRLAELKGVEVAPINE